MNVKGQYNPKDVECISVENLEVLPSGADWQSRHLESERRKAEIRDRIHILGSPAYICVLQRKDRKSIAITPCAAEHPMSFKVPDRLLTDGQCRMMINGIQFIQVLLEANGLAAGKDHQFKGRYDAEKNAVIISLEKDEQSALSPQKCTT